MDLHTVYEALTANEREHGNVIDCRTLFSLKRSVDARLARVEPKPQKDWTPEPPRAA